MGDIHDNISAKLYEEYPEINAEIEKRIEEYGFVIVN
jgi:hypothetical protein